MTKVLLTGGSGFIAAHILDLLLQKGYSVVTTVRSEDKAQKIRDAYKGNERLEVVIVPDIAREDAFDEVVKTPGLGAVLHTASPFHFKASDPQTGLIDPALIGTTAILRALKRSAPDVKRVVVTSSFAAILNEAKFADPTHVFTEKSWNPATIDDIHRSPQVAYRVSKTLAERAAWDVTRGEGEGNAPPAKFELVTVNPPLVLGPLAHHLASLASINTSNERVVDLLQGRWREEIPYSGPSSLWIDVRDAAAAHVRALEIPEAGGRRLFTVAGQFSNRELFEVSRKGLETEGWLSEFEDRLPPLDVKGGGCPPPEESFKYNAEETEKLLGIKYITLEQSVADLVKSLKEHGV